MIHNARHFTIDRLIAELKRCESAANVWFDFCQHHPTGFADSYRGYYEDLALGWKRDYEPPTVAFLLGTLLDLIGKTITGYKGGEYVVSGRTALWVANRGETGSTAVVGVTNHGYRVTINTEEME